MQIIKILSALFLLTIGNLANAQELLPSEQAFEFSTKLVDEEVRISWDIADGYYMYKDRIGVVIQGDAVQTAEAKLPKGKMKMDMALSGKEELLAVYTGKVEFSVPVDFVAGKTFTVLAKGQGCNEPVGVCYPPIEHEIVFADGEMVASTAISNEAAESTANTVPLSNPVQNSNLLEVSNPLAISSSTSQPMMDTNESAISAEATEDGDAISEEEGIDTIDKLRDLLAVGLQEDEFLDVDDAFKVTIDEVRDNDVIVSFDIAEGYYLYRSKTRFSSEGDIRLAAVDLPTGVMKEDPTFGVQEVYKKDFKLPIKLVRQGPESSTIDLFATYQGCAEDGICYAPVNKSFTLELPQIISTAAAQNFDNSAQPSQASDIDSDSSLFNPGEGTPVLWILLGAFVAGIGLAFTPCVLPMIPILSSMIAGQGESLTRTRGGIMAIIYVLGSAVTYAAMGAIAGATGDQLQAYFQTPLAIGILCTILLVMAMSMFGLFRIQMPSFIQSSLQSKTSGLGSQAPMVFILGLVSALIVGACVSPVLISFLGIAISRADPSMGALTMVLMALGMGIPLIVLGFGAGHIIPKAGQWMDTVNHVFGVMLIGVAIYLLQALPSVPVLLLWGGFFIVVSMYMGATSTLQPGASGWQRLFKGLGTILLIWGIIALIGGFFGQRDVLNPLPSDVFQVRSAGEQTGQIEKHLFTRVNNEDELDAQLVTAKADGKLVMIDYYADWCVDCVRMEKSTFQDVAVVNKLEKEFITLQVDVTDPSDQDRKALKRRFGVFGPPAVLFFNSDGTPIKAGNFYGYRDPAEFLAIIDAL